ncbi:MAG: MFS transporter [Thermaerobacter sp.]|nr:MFS transporter [Thermaerobacter sp.]
MLYSAGNFGASLTLQAIAAFLTYFYVQVHGVPPVLISAALIWHAIWAGIGNPLFGHLSDRTRSRFGRRAPYVLLGALPLSAAFILLWLPPAHASHTLLFLWFLGFVFLFDTLYDLVVLNWTALFPEMYRDLAQRASVSAYRQVWGIAGTVLGMVGMALLSGSMGWAGAAVLFGVLTLASLWLSLIGVREDPRASEQAALPLREAIFYTFRNRAFVTYVLGAFFVQFTFVAVSGLIPFYSQFVLGGANPALFFGAALLMAVPGLFLWRRVAVRKGVRTAAIASAVCYALSFVPFLFIASGILALVFGLLVGIGLSGQMLLLDVMIADITDEDEVRSGRRREGMYYGVNGFVVRLVGFLQSLVLLGLAAAGYHAGATHQPAGAILALRLFVGGLPIVSIGIALLFWRLYPLHGARLREVKEQVAALHGAVPAD